MRKTKRFYAIKRTALGLERRVELIAKNTLPNGIGNTICGYKLHRTLFGLESRTLLNSNDQRTSQAARYLKTGHSRHSIRNFPFAHQQHGGES
jgi:hypothetical protein